jgi:cysteine-rich repeat protein
MTMRLVCILVCLAATLACGSRGVAGSPEDHETSETGTTQSPGPSEDTNLFEASTETMGVGSGSTGVSTTDSETTVQGSATTEPSTSAMDATGATENSTGEPMAACGNGVLEVFGLVPEECDDGNLDPDDGCSDTCALDRRVFVTSALYKGGEFKTLKQADARCANLADDQGWPEGLMYRAWLSDSTTNARDRFKRGRGRLMLANGLILAASWSALLVGQLENPIEVTEKSETYHGGVWTGTRPDGTAVPGAEHCEDWATEMALKTGHYGNSDANTAEWTLSEAWDQPSPCIAEYALYCFQSL